MLKWFIFDFRCVISKNRGNLVKLHSDNVNYVDRCVFPRIVGVIYIAHLRVMLCGTMVQHAIIEAMDTF